jgi:hypothetical protein
MEHIRAFHQQLPMLSLATWYNVALLVLSLAGLAIDSRQVTGVNPWVKPIKFETSLIIFLLTTAWLVTVLPAPAAVKRILGGGIAIAMIAEITAIVMQAARGVTSHFNTATPLDAAVFAFMGVMIAINTLLVVWMTVLFFRTQPELAPAVVWGIRLGLILFVCASLQGFLMASNRAHTVGAADGGPGLFFLNWSTQFGDLRVAHFLGMHGIQILPLLGWMMSRTDRSAGTGAVIAAFALIGLLFGWALQQALAARPLWRGTL